jgi:FkbM family methyltransferase
VGFRGKVSDGVHAMLVPMVIPVIHTHQGRELLSRAYGLLSDRERARLLAWVNQHPSVLARAAASPDGAWDMRFAGRRVALPLVRDDLVTWGRILNFVGAEIEVSSFYERLLAGRDRPSVFYDVGGNYGSHSLMLLSHGVTSVYIEPNPACHPYFRQACDLNGWECRIMPVAASDVAGECEFRFPRHEPSLGTIMPRIHQQFQGDVAVLTVAQTTLDQIASDTGLVPDLIKMDVEGAEMLVLRGARNLLATRKPRIVFESWPGPARQDVFSLLADYGYRTRALALRRDWAGFVNQNFVAEP